MHARCCTPRRARCQPCAATPQCIKIPSTFTVVLVHQTVFIPPACCAPGIFVSRMTTNQTIRICSWNVFRGAIEDSWDQLALLQPDVAVLPECASPKDSALDGRVVWTGDNPSHGLGIVAHQGWKLTLLDDGLGPAHTIAARVDGPEQFNLIGVWTLRTPSYVEAMYSVLEHFGRLIRQAPTVIAGDFNTSSTFDTPNSRLNHAEIVRRMEDLGLVSAYHAFHGEGHGEETHPTYYYQWKQDRPFHIDYCFIPSNWSHMISNVSVGNFDKWSQASDHRPLLTELAVPCGDPMIGGRGHATAPSAAPPST